MSAECTISCSHYLSNRHKGMCSEMCSSSVHINVGRAAAVQFLRGSLKALVSLSTEIRNTFFAVLLQKLKWWLLSFVTKKKNDGSAVESFSEGHTDYSAEKQAEQQFFFFYHSTSLCLLLIKKNMTASNLANIQSDMSHISAHLLLSSLPLFSQQTSSARGGWLPGNSPKCMIKTLISNLSPERLMWLLSSDALQSSWDGLMHSSFTLAKWIFTVKWNIWFTWSWAISSSTNLTSSYAFRMSFCAVVLWPPNWVHLGIFLGEEFVSPSHMFDYKRIIPSLWSFVSCAIASDKSDSR